jgi:putative addiction module component (TIGR02574 family)
MERIMASVDDVFAAAMSLPPSERVTLAERLFEVIDGENIDAEIDDDFQQVLSDRIEAFRAGKIQASDADEALDEIERSLDEGSAK